MDVPNGWEKVRDWTHEDSYDEGTWLESCELANGMVYYALRALWHDGEKGGVYTFTLPEQFAVEFAELVLRKSRK